MVLEDIFRSSFEGLLPLHMTCVLFYFENLRTCELAAEREAFAAVLCGLPTLLPKQPLALQYSRNLIRAQFRFSRASVCLLHHGTLNFSTPTTMRSVCSNPLFLLPLEIMTSAPQHRDVQCKDGPFNGRPSLQNGPRAVSQTSPH